VIWQSHHSMGDGVSLLNLLSQALDSRKKKPADEVDSSRLGTGSLKTALALQAALEVPSLAVSNFFARADKSVFRAPLPSGVSGRKRLGLSRLVPVGAVKELARAQSTSVNAVLVAAATLALRERLEQRGAEVPKSLKAWTPIVTRRPEAAWRMENEFVVAVASFPVGLPDALPTNPGKFSQRKGSVALPDDQEGAGARAVLKHAASSLSALKYSAVPFALGFIARGTHALMPEALSAPLLQFVADKATLLFSSLPGPTEPVLWKLGTSGRAVKSISFWSPVRSQVGMSVCSFSYCGQLSLTILTDEAVDRSPQAICDCFATALDVLRLAHGLTPLAEYEEAPVTAAV